MSLSTPKVTEKRASKKKADEKDDHPTKKLFVTLRDKLPKKPSPPKPSHRASKGLMTTSGPLKDLIVVCLLTRTMPWR